MKMEPHVQSPSRKKGPWGVAPDAASPAPPSPQKRGHAAALAALAMPGIASVDRGNKVRGGEEEEEEQEEDSWEGDGPDTSSLSAFVLSLLSYTPPSSKMVAASGTQSAALPAQLPDKPRGSSCGGGGRHARRRQEDPRDSEQGRPHFGRGSPLGTIEPRSPSVTTVPITSSQSPGLDSGQKSALPQAPASSRAGDDSRGRVGSGEPGEVVEAGSSSGGALKSRTFRGGERGGPAKELWEERGRDREQGLYAGSGQGDGAEGAGRPAGGGGGLGRAVRGQGGVEQRPGGLAGAHAGMEADLGRPLGHEGPCYRLLGVPGDGLLQEQVQWRPGLRSGLESSDQSMQFRQVVHRGVGPKAGLSAADEHMLPAGEVTGQAHVVTREHVPTGEEYRPPAGVLYVPDGGGHTPHGEQGGGAMYWSEAGSGGGRQGVGAGVSAAGAAGMPEDPGWGAPRRQESGSERRESGSGRRESGSGRRESSSGSRRESGDTGRRRRRSSATTDGGTSTSSPRSRSGFWKVAGVGSLVHHHLPGRIRTLSLRVDPRQAAIDVEKRAVVETAHAKAEARTPRMSEPSVMLRDDVRVVLCKELPALALGRDWVLLYSTQKHGMSLHTLYRNSALLPGPTMLVVEDRSGAVCGAFTSQQLVPSNRKKYQGTNDSFVFSQLAKGVKVFRSAGTNRYFVLCMNDALAFGGGAHFALWIDRELLNGTSGPCDTFANPTPLTPTEDFIIQHVELWGFLRPGQVFKVPEPSGSHMPNLAV